VIPGNDDAIRSAALMSRIVADAVEEGRFLAQRKEARPGTKAEDVEAPPLDPEEQRRKAEQQRRARDEAAKAQKDREARLREAAKKPPPPPSEEATGDGSDTAPASDAPADAATSEGGAANG
jgi:small subunit ribosomal protein S2